jgi:putative ABC transport system permease protein
MIPLRDEILIRANGDRVAFSEYGDLSGEPVMFCHGWPSSRIMAQFIDDAARELGVRMAVGATSGQIVQLILVHALRWTLAGVAAGLIAAALAARSLASLLFQVHAENPALFGAAALLMIAVSVAAGLAPLLRAAKIDPMIALRHE